MTLGPRSFREGGSVSSLMDRPLRRRLRKIFRVKGDRSWRETLLTALTAWNRHQVARVVGAVFLVWLVGATGLYFAERRANPDFATWADSLWGVWVLLFSGLDQPPKTTAGRLVAMVLLVIGVGTAGSVHGEPGVLARRTLPAEA